MKRIIVLLAAFAVLALALPAQSSAALSVESAAIATNIVDHTPTGVGDSFAYNTEKLYCFSKIRGGNKGDSIEHRWYHGNRLMATVPLKVGSQSWRTFSSKRIIRVWQGDWRVEIVHKGGVLDTLRFTINPPEAPYKSE